ncbi:MAG TPA: GFA family protein [Rhizomicrobium sp.]|nr:GFA family protein [Rhizomicrobium sp.]
MTTRRAQCSCGQLRVTCDGEPAKVSLCNCNECRRRTGSAFGIAAFYPREKIAVEGSASKFRRNSDSGFPVLFHFCPACGSSVYWEPQRKPDMIAIAAGAFADPNYPMPEQSVSDELRHAWIIFPDSMATRTST